MPAKRKSPKPRKSRKPIDREPPKPVELDRQAVDAEIDATLARYGVPLPFPMVHPGRCVSAFDALCVHLGLKPPWEERNKPSGLPIVSKPLSARPYLEREDKGCPLSAPVTTANNVGRLLSASPGR